MQQVIANLHTIVSAAAVPAESVLFYSFEFGYSNLLTNQVKLLTQALKGLGVVSVLWSKLSRPAGT